VTPTKACLHKPPVGTNPQRRPDIVLIWIFIQPNTHAVYCFPLVRDRGLSGRSSLAPKHDPPFQIGQLSELNTDNHQTADKPLVLRPRTYRLLFTLRSIEVTPQVQTRV
jgi:hypothetical protein